MRRYTDGMRLVSNSPAASARRSRPAFTVIEVLVVLFIVGLFVLFSLPMHDRRARPHGNIQCLVNIKQLTLGWTLYTTDYHDQFMANRRYTHSNPAPTNNWVAGVMDWSAHPDNTNHTLLLRADAMALATYVKPAGVYLCPLDRSESAAGRRVRSYAMNAFIGDAGNAPARAGWKQHLQLADLKSPATTLVLADEHANSLDDGSFFNDPGRTSAWVDLPSARHNGATGFSFADGHSEIHKWKEADTRVAEIRNGPKPKLVSPNPSQDLAWVLERSTRPDTNTPSSD